jgi:hypothetical protein
MLSVFDYFYALHVLTTFTIFTKIPTDITPVPYFLFPSININNVSTEQTYESGETLALPSFGFENYEW